MTNQVLRFCTACVAGEPRHREAMVEFGTDAATRAPHRGILVETRVSLISAGTERTMVGLARKSLLAKARERPDLVKRVIEKASAPWPASTTGAAFT